MRAWVKSASMEETRLETLARILAAAVVGVLRTTWWPATSVEMADTALDRALAIAPPWRPSRPALMLAEAWTEAEAEVRMEAEEGIVAEVLLRIESAVCVPAEVTAGWRALETLLKIGSAVCVPAEVTAG